MEQETLDFHITAFIKDRDSNIKELSKKVSLKIYWKTCYNETTGFLNPEWEEYIGRDGRNTGHWRDKGKVFQFEKDGKKYDIWVSLVIKKGWFKDQVIEKDFRAFPSDYSNGKTPDAPFTCGTGYDREVKKQMKHDIIPVKKRREGPILVGIIVLIVVSVLIFFAWKYKKEHND